MNANVQSLEALVVGIGDVAKFLDVPAHTLRFWEKEFGFYLVPVRTIGRQRRYDDQDIDRLTRLKHLLKVEGYSIAGAKRILHKEMEVQNELKNYIELTNSKAS